MGRDRRVNIFLLLPNDASAPCFGRDSELRAKKSFGVLVDLMKILSTGTWGLMMGLGNGMMAEYSVVNCYAMARRLKLIEAKQAQ
jgi:hypothetical protein